MDIDEGDENWLRQLAAAGFSEEDIHAIYNAILNQDWRGDASNDTGVVHALSGEPYCFFISYTPSINL